MTGLEILLYVWLTGWAGSSSYMIYDCYSGEPSRVISRNECAAIGAVMGAAWPVPVYNHVKRKFRGKLDGTTN